MKAPRPQGQAHLMSRQQPLQELVPTLTSRQQLLRELVPSVFPKFQLSCDAYYDSIYLAQTVTFS